MTSVGRVSVAVDIGNSAAKWSAAEEQSGDRACQPTTVLHRTSLAGDDWPEQILGEAERLAQGAPICWRIAAVNAPARCRLVERLAAAGQQEHVRVITHRDLPLVVRVPHAERVGIDRLLAVWKATELYPQRPVVVIDAGSAITIDSASVSGEFLGGVILPGLALQFDSLARGTDALPALRPSDLDEASVADLPVPATDTVTAIRSGIMLGTAAAIDGLVARSIAGTAHQVVLTGGDAARLSAWIGHRHTVLERLVVDAIGSLPT